MCARTGEGGELGGRELEAGQQRRGDVGRFGRGDVLCVGRQDLCFRGEQAVRETVQDGAAFLGGERLRRGSERRRGVSLCCTTCLQRAGGAAGLQRKRAERSWRLVHQEAQNGRWRGWQSVRS